MQHWQSSLVSTIPAACLGGVVGAGFVSSSNHTGQPAAQDVVTAERFVLTGPDGQRFAEFFAEDGNVTFAIRDESGGELFVLRTFPAEVDIRLSTPTGDGEPEVRMALSMSGNGTVASFFDGDRRRRLMLGVLELPEIGAASVVEMTNPDWTEHLILRSTKDQTTATIAADGKSIWSVPPKDE